MAFTTRLALGFRPAVPLVATTARAMATKEITLPYTLYDRPVSNNGARVRMILYYKEVDEVSVELPEAIGGQKSDKFVAVNPQGKIPALVCRDEALQVPESDTIARFVGGKYDGRPGRGKFAPPAGSELALKADRICRHHDLYLVAIQGCLYKATPRDQGFATCGTRDRALDQFLKQLEVLESYVEASGPYMLGDEPTQADVACFPTLAFAERMLPKFDRRFALGPKLSAWWTFMTSGADPVATKIYSEIAAGLDSWEDRDRWGSILGAGLRDESPPTIFDKILAKEIPADVVYEDDVCMAFKDINPVAPVHLLLIPKVRSGLTQLQFATDDHVFLLGHLMSKVGHVAKIAGLDSYRLVVNDGKAALQSVFHLHLHIIGGRDLAWPPG